MITFLMNFFFALVTESYEWNVCFSCHHNGKHPWNSHHGLHKNGFHGCTSQPLSAFLDNLCIHEWVSPKNTMNMMLFSIILIFISISNLGHDIHIGKLREHGDMPHFIRTVEMLTC